MMMMGEFQRENEFVLFKLKCGGEEKSKFQAEGTVSPVYPIGL